jgi:hypothetical protein
MPTWTMSVRRRPRSPVQGAAAHRLGKVAHALQTGADFRRLARTGWRAQGGMPGAAPFRRIDDVAPHHGRGLRRDAGPRRVAQQRVAMRQRHPLTAEVQRQADGVEGELVDAPRLIREKLAQRRGPGLPGEIVESAHGVLAV